MGGNTKILVFICLVTVLVSLTQARGSASFAGRRYNLERRNNTAAFVYFCQCFAGIGTWQVEIAFFSSDPTVLSDPQPDSINLIPSNSAFVFENGGSIEDTYGRNFTWSPPNPTKGYATAGSDHYDIYQGTHATIFKTTSNEILYGCEDYYHGQLVDTNSPAGVNSISTSTLTQSQSANTQGFVTSTLMQQPTSANTQGSTTSTLTQQPAAANTQGFTTSTLTQQPTAANTQGSTTMPVGLSLEAQLSLGIGSSIAVVVLFTFGVLAVRRLRQKGTHYIAESKPVELDGSTKGVALSKSTMIGTLSTPVLAILELHPDTVIEMADTDR